MKKNKGKASKEKKKGKRKDEEEKAKKNNQKKKNLFFEIRLTPPFFSPGESIR